MPTYVEPKKKYYTPSGQPHPLSRGQSNVIRSEFAAIAAAFDAVAGQLTDAYAAAEFGRIYQGSQAADPTLRRDGSALRAGDLFFNASQKQMRVYTGTAWAALPTSVTGFATQGALSAAVAAEAAARNAAIDTKFAAEATLRATAIAAEANARAAADAQLISRVATATMPTAWVPSLTDGAGHAFTQTSSGFYATVGSLAAFTVDINVTHQGAALLNTALRITGMPWPRQGEAVYPAAGIFTGGWTAAGEYMTVMCMPDYLQISKTGVELFNYDGTGFRAGRIRASGCYLMPSTGAPPGAATTWEQGYSWE
jgi:hypothetical protein